MKALLIFIFGILFITPLLACWALPPKYRETRFDNNSKILKNCREEQEVQILNASGNTLIWKTKIHGYNSLFSHFKSNGTHIVHIFGNHMVKSTNEICVVVYAKKREPIVYHAEDFVDQLKKLKDRSSVSPKFMWFEKVLKITDEKLSIQLINGKKATLWLDTKMVAHRDLTKS